jgi:hypothetical protein
MVTEATEKRVCTWLAELVGQKLVDRYLAVGIEVIQVTDWWRDQAGMRRAYPSRWPPPPGWADNVYDVRGDTRPGRHASRTANADSAGRAPRSDASRPETSAPAHADASAYAGSGPAETARPASAEAKTSVHQQFVASWCAEFERIKGSAYIFQKGKDGAHTKAILEFAGGDLETAKTRALALLNSTDPFYAEKGVDLGILHSQWNRLGSAGRGNALKGTEPRGAAYGTFVPPDPEA